MANDLAQLAKYDAWIEELERRQKTLAGNRRGYLRFFAGALVASGVGFVWNTWVGVGTVVTGLLFFAFGVYVVLRREGDYVRELKEARETAERLREAET
jgi:Flp pilus assembly protein TadB